MIKMAIHEFFGSFLYQFPWFYPSHCLIIEFQVKAY